MPYKDKEKRKEYYYKNREAKIKYQREYDRKNKDKKREYDKKRRRIKGYNYIKYIQHYSQKYHFPVLLEKYGGCQLCKSIKKLEIHHIRYTKNIKDCMLLCQIHHKKIHRKI